MKARMVLISSGVIMAIILLVSPTGAQAIPQPIDMAAPTVSAMTTQLTVTPSVPSSRNSNVTAPTGGGGDISPYHKEWHRLTNNDVADTWPVTAFNPQRNEYLVVWEQCDATCGIVGQRTTNRGIPIGDSFIIASGQNEGYPTIGYNSFHGEYLVTYTRYSSVTAGDLYGRIILGNGTLYGTELTIDDSAGFQTLPSIAFNPTATNHGHPGEYLVVYKSADDIVAKHVGSYGDVDASPHLIEMFSTFTTPDVAYNPARHEYLVTYAKVISDTPTIHNSDIHARRLGADGSVLSNRINLAVDSNNATFPQVAAGIDMYFIAYSYGPNDSIGVHNISGSWVTGDGVPVYPYPNTIAEPPPNFLGRPRVAYTGDGFLVTWESSTGPDEADIYGWYLRLQPSYGSTVFTIDATPLSAQTNGDVACATGSCFIVDRDNWYDNGHDYEITAWNIWLQNAFLPLVLK